MAYKQQITDLKNELEQLKNDGIDEVKCEAIITELNNIIENPDATGYDPEKHKIVSQEKIEEYKAKNTLGIEMFKSVFQAGQSAIKYSFFLTGGASVAMLAFISALFTNSKTLGIQHLANSLASFSGGTFLVAIAACTTYLAQRRHSNERSQGKVGNRINNIVIFLVVVSYVLFFWGMYVAYEFFIERSQDFLIENLQRKMFLIF